MGYISSVDDESGNIKANTKKSPIKVGGGGLVSSLQYFK